MHNRINVSGNVGLNEDRCSPWVGVLLLNSMFLVRIETYYGEELEYMDPSDILPIYIIDAIKVKRKDILATLITGKYGHWDAGSIINKYICCNKHCETFGYICHTLFPIGPS